MAIRNLGTILENSLLNNDEFNYAHLVKFEKPTVQEKVKLLKKGILILTYRTERLILFGMT